VNGPSFIEAVCYRYEGHFAGDGLKYRSKDERSAWGQKDPITKLRERLGAAKLLSVEEADEFVRAAERQIDEARCS